MTEHDIERIAPFTNCQFKYCDLIGQCKSEGKCYHPRVEKPQGEAVGFIESALSGSIKNPDIKATLYAKYAIGENKLKEGAELYTTPPDQSAEIARLREALSNVIADLDLRSDDGVVNISHGVYVNAKQALENT
jgi:hypothetical protein